MSIWSSLFGGDNQGAYNNYADMLRKLMQGYTPYTQAGQGGLNQYQKYINQIMQNPGMLERELASSFKTSPQQNQMMSNVKNQMNTNSALTGMMGSTAENTALQNNMAGMENNFMNQYIDRGMNEFNQALGGQYNLAGMGLGALGQYNDLAKEAGQANMAGSMSHNNWLNNMFGDIGGIIGGMAGSGMF